MVKASISRAWDESKAVLATNSRALTAVALALLVLPGIVIGAYAPDALMGMAQVDNTTNVLMLVVTLIGLVGRITIARIALGDGQTVGDTMRTALQRTPAVVGAFLLFLLPVALLLAPFIAQVMRSPAEPPPLAGAAILIIVLIAFVLGVRVLGLVIPAAAAEGLGPLALIKRSWRLTAGNWWRLLALILLFFVASAVVARAIGYVLGALLVLGAGNIDPMSLSALLLATVLAIVGAVFSVLFVTMLTRVYLQLVAAGSAPASVPSSGT